MARNLQLPLQESEIRSLVVNDQVELSGRIYTARDAVHRYLANIPLSELSGVPDLRHAVFYHCGPVVIQEGGEWKITAAGPTTSSREEPYMAALIEKFSLQGIIGKGGMGDRTAAACRDFGCVYLHAVGGAAQILAATVQKVSAVYFLEEFGFPEALWCLEVNCFPAVVTMDAHGNSLHQQVQLNSRLQLDQLFAADSHNHENQ